MPWRHMGKCRYNSIFLDLDTRRRRVVSFTPLPSYSQGKIPCTHQIGGWVDPAIGLDVVEKRRILHCRESNPCLPARTRLLYDWDYRVGDRMINVYGVFVEWELAENTDVPGENLPQYHFVHRWTFYIFFIVRGVSSTFFWNVRKNLREHTELQSRRPDINPHLMNISYGLRTREKVRSTIFGLRCFKIFILHQILLA
jgi:hypothetical protein